MQTLNMSDSNVPRLRFFKEFLYYHWCNEFNHLPHETRGWEIFSHSSQCSLPPSFASCQTLTIPPSFSVPTTAKTTMPVMRMTIWMVSVHTTALIPPWSHHNMDNSSGALWTLRTLSENHITPLLFFPSWTPKQPHVLWETRTSQYPFQPTSLHVTKIT